MYKDTKEAFKTIRGRLESMKDSNPEVYDHLHIWIDALEREIIGEDTITKYKDIRGTFQARDSNNPPKH